MDSKEHSKRFAHFSYLVHAANMDGNICNTEKDILQGIATKLGIEPAEFTMILENPEKFPIQKTTIASKQMRRLYEMFHIIFADHVIDDDERKMVYNFALELGMPPQRAKRIIDKSIDLFSGRFSFEEYSMVVTSR